MKEYIIIDEDFAYAIAEEMARQLIEVQHLMKNTSWHSRAILSSLLFVGKVEKDGLILGEPSELDLDENEVEPALDELVQAGWLKKLNRHYQNSPVYLFNLGMLNRVKMYKTLFPEVEVAYKEKILEMLDGILIPERDDFEIEHTTRVCRDFYEENDMPIKTTYLPDEPGTPLEFPVRRELKLKDGSTHTLEFLRSHVNNDGELDINLLDIPETVKEAYNSPTCEIRYEIDSLNCIHSKQLKDIALG